MQCLWGYYNRIIAAKVKEPIKKLIATAVILIYTALLYIFRLPCPILKLTGIPCLGCGMTRALLMALRLDFKGAFCMHFMFWSLPVLYLCFLFDGKLFKKRTMNIIFYTVLFMGYIINWLFKICFY